MRAQKRSHINMADSSFQISVPELIRNDQSVLRSPLGVDFLQFLKKCQFLELQRSKGRAFLTGVIVVRKVTQVSLKWCFQGTARVILATVNFCERQNLELRTEKQIRPRSWRLLLEFQAEYVPRILLRVKVFVR